MINTATAPFAVSPSRIKWHPRATLIVMCSDTGDLRKPLKCNGYSIRRRAVPPGEPSLVSLAYARAHDAAVSPYVREHAFEMDENVMRAHIGLYVNEYSLDVGDEGIAAIENLFELAAATSMIPAGTVPEFV